MNNCLNQLKLFTLIFVFAACNSSQTANKQEERELCGPTNNIDTNLLQLGNPLNLDLYNGIKNYKFGIAQDDYRDCINCYKLTRTVDSCSLERMLHFLDENWKGSLYFIDQKLSCIEITCEQPNISETYCKLRTIFGFPNLKSPEIFDYLKVHKKVNSKGICYIIVKNTNYKLSSYSRRYSEESFHDNNEISVNDDWPANTSGDIDHDWASGSKRYNNKVDINYYQNIRLKCSWKSNVILEYSILINPYLKESLGKNWAPVLKHNSDITLVMYLNEQDKIKIELGKAEARKKLNYELEAKRNDETLKKNKQLLKEF